MAASIPFSPYDIAIGLAFGLIVLFVVSHFSRSSPERNLVMAVVAVKLLVSVTYNVYLLYGYGGGDTLYYHDFGVEYANSIRSSSFDAVLDYLLRYSFFLPGGTPTDRMYNFGGLAHFLLFDSFIAVSFLFA